MVLARDMFNSKYKMNDRVEFTIDLPDGYCHDICGEIVEITKSPNRFSGDAFIYTYGLFINNLTDIVTIKECDIKKVR